MRIPLLITFLIFSQLCFAQRADNTGITTSRVNIAGTKYSMIVPPGFTKAPNFTGFQNSKTGSSILFVEVPGDYVAITKSFTREALSEKGMELISSETVAFNDDSAMLLKVKQPVNSMTYNKLILIFGDKDKTVIVNAITPENSNQDEPKLRQSLFSVLYNEGQEANPTDAAPFTINTEGTGMQVVKYIAGTLFYSMDAKMPTETPSLTVGTSLTNPFIADPKSFAEERIKKFPRGDSYIIKHTTAVIIDSMKGYEIVANGKTQDGKPEIVYMTMLFNPGRGYFIIIGNAKENFLTYEDLFRRITKTFSRRPE